MAKIALFFAIVVLLPCAPVWAAEHAAEGEASGGFFSGSVADSAWTVIAFVTLAVVLGTVAWKPLLKALDARQNHIAQEIKSAEDSRQKAEHMLEDYKQQGHTVVRQASEEAQRQHQQTIEQTREEVLTMRRRAHEEIQSAQAAAMEALWKETGDIVLRVGTEVLGRAMSAQDNQRLIDEAVARVKQSGGL
jgi:F-type H+-transporting ATPase subunit b